MKKFFLPIFAVLLVLGSTLPLAAYRVTRAVLSGAEPASSAVSSPAASAQPPNAVPSADAETFLVEDQATGQVLELSRQEYVLGAVAAEMPVSWPDEALKAQAVAAHSYALYCRDHTTLQSGAWLTADPARRQGCLTEPVLRSYWGTAYEQNYARLSALVDEVLDEILYYENAPACASYFAIPMGRPRPAKMYGIPPCPTSFQWTAAPTVPLTTTNTPSPFPQSRCSRSLQALAFLPTSPRRRAGSARQR